MFNYFFDPNGRGRSDDNEDDNYRPRKIINDLYAESNQDDFEGGNRDDFKPPVYEGGGLRETKS